MDTKGKSDGFYVVAVFVLFVSCLLFFSSFFLGGGGRGEGSGTARGGILCLLIRSLRPQPVKRPG